MWIETPTWEEQQAFSDMEWAPNPAKDNSIAAHGEDVWNPKDMLDKNPDKKENPLLEPLTLEEMTLQRGWEKERIGEAAKKNLDWPPAADNPSRKEFVTQKVNDRFWEVV